jgi:3-oxoadipate enol-lactonase
MPFVDNQGTKIYWDEQGSGAPVLLIMGLGYGSRMWHRTRPFLAKKYRTIALDNRGVGQSEVPPGPYSIAAMASDAAAVLDSAGVQRAHVYGVSMGGMIAQEFALQYPERVQSLILGCTAAGGPTAQRTEPAALASLQAVGSTPPEQSVQAAVAFLYDANTPRSIIDEDIAKRLSSFPTKDGYQAQLHAIFDWESYSRLPQINAPTLVIHGKSDRLVPPGNGELIAARIPGARLVLLEHAGHLFSSDQTDATHKAIVEFLSSLQDAAADRASRLGII